VPSCEADGPTFEAVRGSFTGRTATVGIHLLGGPGPVAARVIPEVSWCAGLANGTNGGSVNEPVRISAVQPVEQSSPRHPGPESRRPPWTSRHLLAAVVPPLALMPMTTEQAGRPSLAHQLHDRRYRRVMGKHLVNAYQPARRTWRKVRAGTATEAIVDGVIGPWPRREVGPRRGAVARSLRSRPPD